MLSCIMKFKYFILSSLAFVQFSNAQDTKDVKIHNDLSTALEQVDTDGEYLKLEKSGALLEKITKIIDEYLLPDMVKSGDVPEKFGFTKILDLSGISEIAASSQSVKQDGNSYISKFFAQTNGSRKGILSLLGKTDLPWASLEYAPANTSLLIETHLDLTSVPEIMKQIAPMMEKRTAKEMLDGLNEKGPLGKNTLEQMFLQANARISVIAELDKTKTWQAEGHELPAIHVTGRIDGIAKFLWEQYGAVISQQIPTNSKGNIHTIISPEKIPSAWGQLTPILVIDTDKNHIWFSLSAEHLQACQSGKSKLTDNKDFQLVNKHNQDSGAARIFLSQQTISIFMNILETGMRKEMKAPMEQKMLKEVFKYMQNFSSISSCVSHDDKGILVHTNAPFPLKSMQLAGVPMIASLAGLSYGPIMKHLEASQRTEDIMKVKVIYSGLLGYMAGNDNAFPNNLQQAVDGGNLDQRFLTLENRKLHYIKGLTPIDANKIILYTSPDKTGKVIFAKVDGSVRAVDQFEFEKLLTKQNK
jgi:hypothetical protein